MLRWRAIQQLERKASGMTLKGTKSVTLESEGSPIHPLPEDTYAGAAPSQEEISRACEIYLERDGLPGDELADWLRAERALQKVALFKRAWNRLERRDRSDSETEIDIWRWKTMERGNQR